VNYRVFWAPQAEKQLEAILQDLTEQVRIAAAARRIDESLASSPLTFGESRYDTLRVGFELPLGIDYEVLQDLRTVIVYHVWRIDS
jgi:hypothetical protein